MFILVLNSGSSSIKYQLFQFKKNILKINTNDNKNKDLLSKYKDIFILKKGLIEINSKDISLSYKNAIHSIAKIVKLKLRKFFSSKRQKSLFAIGHRVVHGGEYFKKPILINDSTLHKLNKLTNLAPLHNPISLLSIKLVKLFFWSNVKQIAVFDTSFHSSLPEHSWRYAIPNYLYSKFRIRRYGFHGISYQYILSKYANFMNTYIDKINCIIAHIGNGSSIVAISKGKSVDTSMGFTPLEGLVMGTRSGDIDPALPIFLQKSGFSLKKVEDMFNKQSGFKGLTGKSDLRKIELMINDKNKNNIFNRKNALNAMNLATYKLAKIISSYHICPLRKTSKTLIFTGGIGENSSMFRALTLKWLKPLNIKIDKLANNNIKKDVINLISNSKSKIKVFVISTNEEIEIAYYTYLIAFNK